MLRFNVRNLVRSVAVLALLLVGVFVPVLAQADITVSTSVFSDDFTGNSLDTTKWTPYTSHGGSITMDGITSVVLDSQGASVGNYSQSAELDSNSALNFGSSPNDWGVQVKFQMQSGRTWDSKDDPAQLSKDRQYVILSGLDGVGDWKAQGFNLCAVRYDGSNWQLGWYGWDNSGNRVTTELGGAEPLSSSQTHVIDLHRKTNGNVDIYLDNSLVGTEALIGGSNPVALIAGDLSTEYGAGIMALDSVSIGAFSVPEPSSMVLLTIVGLGLLAYAWRKRR